MDVDAAGSTAVTASLDGTVRVWAADSGVLRTTIRLPRGQGRAGAAYAVAISPDGSIIATGGWMRFSEGDPEEQVYLFDAASGAMIGRLAGLPNVVLGLAFSPDGKALAVTLGGGFGMRLYGRGADGWTEVRRDAAYHGGKPAQGVAFAPDGRFATTSYDGRIRLYDRAGKLLRQSGAGGPTPFGIAFSPDGGRLAVGHVGVGLVELFDATTLAPLPAPPAPDGEAGDLPNVAWSADGRTLYAAGTQHLASGVARIAVWEEGRAGSLEAERGTILALRGLPGGDLIVASGDPWIGRLAAGGERRWQHLPVQMDAREQHATLAVSDDGTVVEFGYLSGGRETARFDVATLKLLAGPAEGGWSPRPTRPRSGSPAGTRAPSPACSAGRSARMSSRCPAASPSRRPGRGSSSAPSGTCAPSMRGRRAAGGVPAPGAAWAVNVSGDGRLAVAAFGDGTIRWYRMEDGDRASRALSRWRTGPTGCSGPPRASMRPRAGARTVLRWHVNRGWDAAGDSVPVSAIPQTHAARGDQAGAAATRHLRGAGGHRATGRSGTRSWQGPAPASSRAPGCTC